MTTNKNSTQQRYTSPFYRLKPQIIGHHFLHLLSPPRLSVLFYESESSWRQRDQQIVPHGPHIITKNNSFEIKVSPPRSLLDFLSNYFFLVKDGIMSKHRRLLIHIKGKKILRISALCQHTGIFNNAIPTWQCTGHTGTSVLPQFTKSKCFPRACTWWRGSSAFKLVKRCRDIVPTI